MTPRPVCWPSNRSVNGLSAKLLLHGLDPTGLHQQGAANLSLEEALVHGDSIFHALFAQLQRFASIIWLQFLWTWAQQIGVVKDIGVRSRPELLQGFNHSAVQVAMTADPSLDGPHFSFSKDLQQLLHHDLWVTVPRLSGIALHNTNLLVNR